MEARIFISFKIGNFKFVVYQDKENNKFYINYAYQDMVYDRSKRFEIKEPKNIQFYIDSTVRINSDPFNVEFYSLKEEVKWYKGGKLEDDDNEWKEEEEPEELKYEYNWDTDYFIKNIFNRVKIKGEFTVEDFIEKFNELPKEFRRAEKPRGFYMNL